MTAPFRRLARLVPLLVWLAACGAGDPKPGDSSMPAAEPPSGTPVQAAVVELATLREVVSAPGETVALVEQKIRAPFSGTLAGLDVVEGDWIERGQRLGSIVARDSEAALAGAEEMARQAVTPAEEADARKALELARENRVAAPIEASLSGVVTARSAADGDRVSEDQELLAVAAGDAIVFRAEVAQGDLVRLGDGQSATVDLAGESAPVPAVVHSLLPGSASGDLTVPVRVDFARPLHRPGVGLFGTVHVTVARHRDVPVVPAAAVLRDDVRGTARVGTVGPDGHLHWLEVETGLEDDGRVEIVSPPIDAGTRVVVSGQVGLPEGAPLVVRP